MPRCCFFGSRKEISALLCRRNGGVTTKPTTKTAFFGVQWIAGDWPTYYVDVDDTREIYYGRGISYGKIKNSNERQIHVFENMNDRKPKVTIHLTNGLLSIIDKNDNKTTKIRIGSKENMDYVVGEWTVVGMKFGRVSSVYLKIWTLITLPDMLL